MIPMVFLEYEMEVLEEATPKDGTSIHPYDFVIRIHGKPFKHSIFQIASASKAGESFFSPC